MTARPLSPGAGPTRRATRVGNLRPSQLVTAAGVGAVVDLPGMSVIVRGLDTWPPEGQVDVVEPRLLSAVRQRLGPQVARLKAPPLDATDDPWSSVGIPVTPFPRWVRCLACFRLGHLDGSEFTLVHTSPRHPHRAKIVHVTCPKQQTRSERSRRPCIAARFAVACEKGHLDDFPYVEFVHHGGTDPCPGPLLRISDQASTLSPQVTIACTQCPARRNVSAAAGRKGRDVLPLCRGRHPHLQVFEGCGEQVRLVVLGASNLWFPDVLSALHLPTDVDVVETVSEHWDVLQAATTEALTATLLEAVPSLAPLRRVPGRDVWSAIEKVRATGRPGAAGRPQETAEDLRAAEWELLSHPTTERQDGDFKAVPTATPPGYDALLEQVVLVKRLREVRAMVGFSRLVAPDLTDGGGTSRVRLSREPERWVPAVEQRGEGLFLELRGEVVSEWEERVSGHPRLQALGDCYARWAAARDRPTLPDFSMARYLLLHTLSHLLIRQVSLECGYSSASIRERLYVGGAQSPAAGILLTTAASDSEGTLGGLVAQGEPGTLGRLLDEALREAGRCSSDPLCAEHQPRPPFLDLHGAACHACLFAFETTCEANNRWLDRAVVADIAGPEFVALP
jgi:hypothetical protein